MILLDANLLLYAFDENATHHASAKGWLAEALHSGEDVGVAWTVLLAFVRIGTNPRIIQVPLSLPAVSEIVTDLLEDPAVVLLQPTPRHLELFLAMLNQGQATANLVNDAHLAALAIEHGATLCSADRDFARFPGLKWKNPLE